MVTRSVGGNSLLSLFLFLAFLGNGKAIEPLMLSKPLLILNSDHDVVTMHNPNSDTLFCDSMEVWGEQRVGQGALLLTTKIGTSEPGLLQLFLFSHSRQVDTGGFQFETTINRLKSEIVFPSQGDFAMSFGGFDKCPACKISAANPIQDTVHFKFVFHYSEMTDTLLAIMDANEGLTGLFRNHGMGTKMSGISYESGFDILGRRKLGLKNIVEVPLLP